MKSKTTRSLKIKQATKLLTRVYLVAVWGLLLGSTTVHSAQAAVTRTVNTLTDTAGGNCSGGTCSLRDAVSLSADGGAIYSEGQLTVEQSAFFDNLSAGTGDAIATLGELYVTNSTFYENRAKVANALAFDNNDGSGTLTNVTLYDTLLTGELISSIDHVAIKNSLFATPGKMSCEIVFQPNPTNTNNLANDGTCKAGFSVVTLAQMNLELKNNYLLPLPGSVAIDSGANTGCPPVDQRGWPRPVDGDGAGGAICDIGAIEATENFSEVFIPVVRR